MANEKNTSDSKKTDELGKVLREPQLVLVTAHIISLTLGVIVAVGAVVGGIYALIDGGGMITLRPFTMALISAMMIIVAGITAKKITDKDILRKGYSIAMAVLSVVGSIAFISAIAILPFALFAVGAGSEVQKELWLDKFLPILAVAITVEAVVFLVYKLQKGMAKLMSIVTYVTLGLASIALILSIIATFIGFYSRNNCRNPSSFDSYTQYLRECAGNLFDNLF